MIALVLMTLAGLLPFALVALPRHAMPRFATVAATAAVLGGCALPTFVLEDGPAPDAMPSPFSTADGGSTVRIEPPDAGARTAQDAPAAPAPDAGLVSPDGRQDGPTTTPDAGISAPDAGPVLPDAARDAPTPPPVEAAPVCTPMPTAILHCWTGEPFASPGQFCVNVYNVQTSQVHAMPAECQCKETFSCACLLAYATPCPGYASTSCGGDASKGLSVLCK